MSKSKLVPGHHECIRRCNTYCRTDKPIPIKKSMLRDLLIIIEREYNVGKKLFRCECIYDHIEEFNAIYPLKENAKQTSKFRMIGLLSRLKNEGYIKVVYERIIVDVSKRKPIDRSSRIGMKYKKSGKPRKLTVKSTMALEQLRLKREAKMKQQRQIYDLNVLWNNIEKEWFDKNKNLI